MSTPDLDTVRAHQPVHDLPEHDLPEHGGAGDVRNDSPVGANDHDGAPETHRDTLAERPIEDRFEDGGGPGDDGEQPFAAVRAEPSTLGVAAAGDAAGGDLLTRLRRPDVTPANAPIETVDAGSEPATAAASADRATDDPNGPTVAAPTDPSTPGIEDRLGLNGDEPIPVPASETPSVLGYTPPEGLTQLRFYEEPSVDEGGQTKTWLIAEGTANADDIGVRQLDNGDFEISVGPRLGEDDEAPIDFLADRATVPANLRFNLRVRGGAGDDRIVVDDSVTGTPNPDDPFLGAASIHYEGGIGNDTLIGSNNAGETFIGGQGDDIIDGRGGDDYVEGGIGNDVIDGGAGRDVLYGGQDQDTIRGGSERDYIDGGKGHDEIWGGDGNDTLAGGQGNDRVFGEGGIDTLMGNSNAADQAFTAPDGTVRTGDVLDGGEGSDRMIYGVNTDVVADADDAPTLRVDPSVILPSGDRIGTSVEVHGSAEFVDRMEDDLEVIRSTHAGQNLLSRLDATGKRIGIFEQEDRNNAFASGLSTPTPTGFDVSAFMDPQRYDLNAVPLAVSHPEEHFLTPSSVLLQHELFHDWDFLAGGTARFGETNDTPNTELRAVGLPYDQTDDGIPDAAPSRITGITENAFRTELGMPLRNHYTRAGDIENFDGDAFAPYRQQELPGVNPPEYDAPYIYRPDSD